MFTPKKKEPILSEEIEAVIKRSMGEEVSEYPNVQSRSDDIYRYKYRVMQELLKNEDLLRALHVETLSDEVPLNGDKFRGTYIFDYMKLPDLQDHVNNYVCFEVYTRRGNDRDIEVKLNIRTVCHFDDNQTDWNINRQDLLGLIISNSLDWSYIFGGITMYKTSDYADVNNKGFCYRDMVYTGYVANNYHSRVSH